MSSAPSAGRSTTRPTSSPTPPTRARSRRSWNGRWAANAAVIPFGGGTSVVGGVEPAVDPRRFDGVVTIDLGRLDRVLEVDAESLSARIASRGERVRGWRSSCAAHDLTLRHFPQSFQFATLGGMIATRAGGHFATVYTHIDDLVQSVRAVTPAGVWESRRLPGSGAGISPDRMLIGSEGTLGLITEAWVRVRPRPRFRASAGVRFATFQEGAAAVRALSQSGLYPANCRLIDPDEAELTGAGDGSHALLVLGFESAASRWRRAWTRRSPAAPTTVAPGTSAAAGRLGRRVGGELARRVPARPLPARHVRGHGRDLRDVRDRRHLGSVRGAAPDVMERTTGRGPRGVRRGLGDLPLHPRLSRRARPLLHGAGAGPARARSSSSGRTSRPSAADAILDAGGTITHHHAVGRDHRPWYDRQRPEPFADGAARRQGGAGPGRGAQPRGPDRLRPAVTTRRGRRGRPARRAPTGRTRA